MRACAARTCRQHARTQLWLTASWHTHAQMLRFKRLRASSHHLQEGAHAPALAERLKLVSYCVFCCCLQGILQGLELHSIYQLTVEFTRALRDAVKQLLRQYKLPEVRSLCMESSIQQCACWLCLAHCAALRGPCLSKSSLRTCDAVSGAAMHLLPTPGAQHSVACALPVHNRAFACLARLNCLLQPMQVAVFCFAGSSSRAA